MKRPVRRFFASWVLWPTAIAGMSAYAGTPTPAPQAHDTLAVWTSPVERLVSGVDASGADTELSAQADLREGSRGRESDGNVLGENGSRTEVATSAPVLEAGETSTRRAAGTPPGGEMAPPSQRPATALAPTGLTPVSMRPAEPVDSWKATPPLLPDPQAGQIPAGPPGTDDPAAAPGVPSALSVGAVGPAVSQDLWERIRVGLAVSDIDGPLVRNWERWYAERPDYVQRMTERAGRYLFHIVEEVDRRGLPMELALLPFIESAFNPQALSVAKASGIWQFMPATGKDFDLTQNLFRDDRRHVLASTDAALSYLQLLHGMFGDWHLALAAYNWGQGNVQRALDRQSRNGAGRPSYEQLAMPAETRNYVPKLQAIENILRDPTAFGLTLPPLENHPYFSTVTIDRDIDVDLVSRLAGLPKDDFHALNPQLNKPVVLAAGTPEILLPYDNAQQFESALATHEGPRASWTAWVAPRTLHPRDAALQTGLTEARLREINRIPKGMLIRAGSTLLVPRPEGRQSDVSSAVADTARISLAPDGPRLQRKTVRAKSQGERLSALASRYGVSARNVATWNGLSVNATLKPRQAVVLMLPVRPATNVSKAATSKQARATAAKQAPSTAVAKR